VRLKDALIDVRWGIVEDMGRGIHVRQHGARTRAQV
jgi:hypothetical protein